MNCTKKRFKCDNKTWGITPIKYLATNFRGPELRFFLSFAEKFAAGKKLTLLDLGCGGGSVANFLKNRFPNWNVYGLDISSEAIRLARKRYKHIHFIKASAQNIPYTKEFFDLVISLDSLEHFENVDLVISEITRVLKRNAILVTGIPLSKQPLTLSWMLGKLGFNNLDAVVGHVNSFDNKEICTLMKKHNLNLVRRSFSSHYFCAAVNIAYYVFQILMKKQIHYETHVEDTNNLTLKYSLRFIEKTLALLFYVESSLFYWFPGTKGNYVFRKS